MANKKDKHIKEQKSEAELIFFSDNATFEMFGDKLYISPFKKSLLKRKYISTNYKKAKIFEKLKTKKILAHYFESNESYKSDLFGVVQKIYGVSCKLILDNGKKVDLGTHFQEEEGDKETGRYYTSNPMQPIEYIANKFEIPLEKTGNSKFFDGIKQNAHKNEK